MRDIIREKLDKLDELFPAERLAKSKERWRRLWAGEPKLDRLPFMAEPLGLPMYDFTPAPGRLLLYLDRCIAHGHFEDDYIPSFFPGCHNATIPNMFGAREIIKGEDCTCERLLPKGYEQIAELPEPRIEKGSLAHGWLEMQRYVLEETEGRFPVHVIDMQGPVDVAGQLVGYDQLYLAAMEAPELYEKLLNATTDAFIMFWRAQQKLLGASFVGTHLWGHNYMPLEFGATASVDSMVMISGPFFEEHFAPYLERIAAQFGGITVHSCGKFGGMIPNLMRTKGLRGVNASEMSVKQLAEAGVDGRVVILAGNHIDTIDDMVRYLKDNGLRADLTLWGVWPWHETGGFKMPEDWTEADKSSVQRKNEKLLACFA